MYTIFLDESGDLGFNPKKRNSKYFVVTVLSTPNKKPIERIVKRIHSQLRKRVKRLSGGILHAYKEKPVTKTRLLNLLSKTDCAIMTIYLNKEKVYTRLQEERHVLYNYVTNILLDRIMNKQLVDTKSKIYLMVSKRETNKFLNENFKNYLKDQLTNKHSANIEIEIKTARQEKSLQAVDFVSWAIFRRYEKDDDSYYKLVKRKIIEESPLFP